MPKNHVLAADYYQSLIDERLPVELYLESGMILRGRIVCYCSGRYSHIVIQGTSPKSPRRHIQTCQISFINPSPIHADMQAHPTENIKNEKMPLAN